MTERSIARGMPAVAYSSGILWIAAWFGLATGLLEGVTKSLLRGVPGFAVRVSPEILWIAPVFNLALFLLMGGGLALLFRLVGRPRDVRVAVGLLSVVTIFGVLLPIVKMYEGALLILSLGVAVQIYRRLENREQIFVGFVRRSVMVLLVVGLLAGGIGAVWGDWQERYIVGGLPPPQPGAANVLLITLDTLRADHLSSYGYKRPTTPSIDRLAQRGVLFEHAFSNSSWTLPAHVSLLTGRLPHEHKADWWDPLDGKYPTLAEAVAAKGYTTAAFSANDSYVTPEWGLGRGFTRFEVYGSSLGDYVVRTAYGRKLALNVLPHLLGYFDRPGRKGADQVNREFFRWLDGTNGRPFLALLNYFDVHDPYLTVPAYQSRFSAEVTRGDAINSQLQAYAFRRKPVLTAEEIQQEINGYDGSLAYLDAQLGLLFSELARRGLDRNTLVIVTSDHGESFGNHDLFGHGNSLYFETLHVPLIFYWPGKIPAGVRIPQVVSLHQIPATVMELLGGFGGHPFPGKSMARLWARGTSETQSDPVVSEVSRVRGGPPDYPTTASGLKSLITDEWHLILSDSGQAELYAWREDRLERNDLAESPVGRVVVQELERQFRGLLGAPHKGQ